MHLDLCNWSVFRKFMLYLLMSLQFWSYCSGPPYVGRDYYCETGYNAAGHSQTFFPNDPLWDGQQCVGVEAPCCTHPNMPWFTKTLGETTTEDIQLRLCNDHGIGDEETLLQLIDLYVYWHKQFFCSMQWLCITVWIVISLHIPKLCS